MRCPPRAPAGSPIRRVGRCAGSRSPCCPQATAQLHRRRGAECRNRLGIHSRSRPRSPISVRTRTTAGSWSRFRTSHRPRTRNGSARQVATTRRLPRVADGSALPLAGLLDNRIELSQRRIPPTVPGPGQGDQPDLAHRHAANGGYVPNLPPQHSALVAPGSCAYVNSVSRHQGPRATGQQGQQVGVDLGYRRAATDTSGLRRGGVRDANVDRPGETFTLTAIVHNDGVRSDDARMSIGFPNLLPTPPTANGCIRNQPTGS